MHAVSSQPRRFPLPTALAVVGCAVIMIAASAAAAEDADRRVFDLPADNAARSLMLFAQQSGRGVIAGDAAMSGVTTNAVKGEMTPRRALDQMLAKTGLIASLDEKTGAFAVRKAATETEPGSHGRSQPAAPDGSRDLKKNETRNPKNQDPMKGNSILAKVAGALALMIAPTSAQVAPTATNAASTTQDKKEDVHVLSPFEVVSDTRGYYSVNTMSGTRLNTKLEDLASSISVVTKEQMADFAMLDMNDVFLYTANTEGTGTYTEFEVEAGNGEVRDAVAGDPINANRIRGIGNANVSNDGFPTSNRVPIDPLDSDGVEISRGPNANIFGLGNASGTVNIVSASANLSRDRSQAGFRVDSFEGYRASIDLNRVLLKDRLAARVSAVRQREGFDLKPSGVDTVRYNAMVQYRPLQRTSLKASYQYYRAAGNRPNALPPLDGISDWVREGSPTWDNLTNTLRRGSQVLSVGAPPAYVQSAVNFGRLFVDRDGIALWTATNLMMGDNPLSTLAGGTAMPWHLGYVHTRARLSSQPLVARQVDMISDQDIYDWTSINLNAPNRFRDRTKTARVTLDQVFFETPHHSLAAQAGWFREDSDRYTRYIMADGGVAGGPNGQVVMDINERLLDGSPNPFFLRPALTQPNPRPLESPLRSDTYRLQFAYKIDLASQNGIRRWLGTHNIVGYGEYREKVERSYRFIESFVSDNSWIFGSDGNRSTNSRLRPYFLFYVGDNQGRDIDYAPGNYSHGNYTYVWGRAGGGGMIREPVVLGSVPEGIASGSRTIQKTDGIVLQSTLLKGRLITTLGARDDRHYTKFQNPTRLANRGFSYDYEYMNQWAPGDWEYREGKTMQRGAVVKPFRGFPPLARASEGTGLTRFFANALRGLSLHYNQSETFKPAAPAQNVFSEWLPDPAGKGTDYGFALDLFEGKLVLRVNKYETKQINSRAGASAAFARTLWTIDHTSTNLALQQEASAWITDAARARGQTLTQAQLNAELERVMGIPPRTPSELASSSVAETDDIVGEGHEVELHFNPTPFWTVQAAFTEKQTINIRMAQNVSRYVAERMPYWTTIVDPRTNTLWWNTLYGGSETPFQNFRRTVGNPMIIAVATEGLVRPQIRRYSGTLTTNLRLSGVTARPILRRFNVGGAVRYESRGAIGYYGLQQPPEIITEYDTSRPIWDKAHVYVDMFASYRVGLYADKVNMTLQLNVRNLQEGGRLQPVAAYPDGRPSSFRIISPRQFIFSATFDL